MKDVRIAYNERNKPVLFDTTKKLNVSRSKRKLKAAINKELKRSKNEDEEQQFNKSKKENLSLDLNKARKK